MGNRDPGRLGHAGSARTKKRAIVAIFVMATFGLTALLSVPSHFFRLPLRVPPPIRQAIVPFEPVIPILPGGGPGGPPRIQLSHGVVVLALRAVAPQPPFGGLIPPAPVPSTHEHQQPPKTPVIDRRRAGGKQYFLPSGHDPHEPGCASSPLCLGHGPGQHPGHDRDRHDGRKDDADHHGRGGKGHGRSDRGDWTVRKEGTPGRPAGPGGPGHRVAPAR